MRGHIGSGVAQLMNGRESNANDIDQPLTQKADADPLMMKASPFEQANE